MIIDNDPRSGRLRTSTDERTVKLVADALQDRCATRAGLSRATGAKNSQENAQELTSLLATGPLILHDNARPHIADAYGWKVLPHAPYSTDMSPPDFDLFPKLKESMRGRLFFSGRVFYRRDGTRAIRHMKKSSVLDGIVMLPKRWDSVIENQGDYTEGL